MFTNSHTHHSNDFYFEIFQGEMGISYDVFHSKGIHPWKSNEYRLKNIELQLFNIDKNTLAIGECGLDALKGPSLEIQIPIFEKHIEISEQTGLPLIIHCVKAWNELLVLKKKYRPKQKWIFHGFSKFGILNQVINSEMMISLGAGIINHSKKSEIISKIPDHLLLVETDDVNIDIKVVYEQIAEIKGISLHELNERVTSNFKNTFNKW